MGSRIFLVAGLLFLAQLANGQGTPRPPALPRIPERTFKIGDYGAVPNSSADAAGAIQAAIDAAAAKGGGSVEIPSGEFLSGPLLLASSVDLHLASGAVLRILPMSRYPTGSDGPKNFISGEGLHDISISGSGTIDGQGADWWPLAKKRHDKAKKDDRRPRMIALESCERVLIEGVKLMNSPRFHIAIGGPSADVTIQGITIRAPASDDPVTPSHNTDACNLTAKRVLIKNCDISVGDDNFTCHGGTSDVLITHCTYGNGHGVSIGSGTDGGLTDILVEDCTFTNTECGIRIKSDRDRGGLVQRLTYRNLRMTNVGCPIQISGAYMATQREYRNLDEMTAKTAVSYPAQPVTNRTPIYRDITFTNITATAAPGRRAGLIWGLPEAPASNILLRNVNITADKPFGIFAARNVRLENCKITTREGVNKIATGDADVRVVASQE